MLDDSFDSFGWFSASRSVECCYPIVFCISLGDLYYDIEEADGLTIRSIRADR